MGPLSYMQSIVDRNVIMQRIYIYIYIYIYMYIYIYCVGKSRSFSVKRGGTCRNDSPSSALLK